MSLEIISEAGVSHGGNLAKCLKLADAAKGAGADVFKTQTFITEKTLRNNDPDFRLIKSVELSYNDTIRVARHCEDIKIEFMSTPDHLDDLRFLVEECDVKRIKIGSADLLNKLLVDAAYQTGKPVILSTGMAEIHEIGKVLPHDGGFVSVTLLHCMTLYPTPDEHANLGNITSLKGFGYPVGYSDHTVGGMAAYLAMALGATVIEKHFCPNGYKGVDQNVSMIPLELKMFIDNLRHYKKMLNNSLLNQDRIRADSVNLTKLRKGTDGLRGLNESG